MTCFITSGMKCSFSQWFLSTVVMACFSEVVVLHTTTQCEGPFTQWSCLPFRCFPKGAKPIPGRRFCNRANETRPHGKPRSGRIQLRILSILRNLIYLHEEIPQQHRAICLTVAFPVRCFIGATVFAGTGRGHPECW